MTRARGLTLNKPIFSYHIRSPNNDTTINNEADECTLISDIESSFETDNWICHSLPRILPTETIRELPRQSHSLDMSYRPGRIYDNSSPFQGHKTMKGDNEIKSSTDPSKSEFRVSRKHEMFKLPSTNDDLSEKLTNACVVNAGASCSHITTKSIAYQVKKPKFAQQPDSFNKMNPEKINRIAIEMLETDHEVSN